MSGGGDGGSKYCNSSGRILGGSALLEASSIALNFMRFSEVRCFQKGGGAGNGAFGSPRSWFAMTGRLCWKYCASTNDLGVWIKPLSGSMVFE